MIFRRPSRRDADPAAGDVRAFCRTAGAGTLLRRQVTPVVMTTGHAVTVPPSKSLSRQEYATGAPHHVHRDLIYEAFLTLACAIICWRRTAEPSHLLGPLRRQRLLSGWLSTRRL
jgi:hypothetical protein